MLTDQSGGYVDRSLHLTSQENMTAMFFLNVMKFPHADKVEHIFNMWLVRGT